MAADASQIGLWLREKREALTDYSIEDAARLIDVTERTLRKWEKGLNAPPADKLFALITLYGRDAILELPALLAKWERASALAAGAAGRRVAGGKRREG